MIDSSFVHTRKRYVRSVSIPIFAMSLFLIAIFVASCGDEGDTTEDTPGMTDVLQPATTPPPAQTPVPPAEQPVVEEPVVAGVSFKDDIQPILAERCAVPGCHAAAGAARGLNLSQYDTFKKGGVTGDPRSSPAMVKAVLSSNALMVVVCLPAAHRWMETKSNFSLIGLTKVPKIINLIVA